MPQQAGINKPNESYVNFNLLFKNKQLSVCSTIRVPFDTAHHAEIAYRVLKVDQEPRRNFVQKTLSLDDDVLVVHFQADQVKRLRTAITSFFESLLLFQDTIKLFGGEKTSAIESQEVSNAGAQPSANTA